MIVIAWRKPDPPLVTQWRGATGRAAASALSANETTIATLIGPPGIAGPAPLSGKVTIIMPNGQGAFEHQQSFEVEGILPSHRLFVALAPVSDDDENCPEMIDITSLSGATASDSITITASFAAPVSGPVILNWSAF
jgi:hypothetical protein